MSMIIMHAPDGSILAKSSRTVQCRLPTRKSNAFAIYSSKKPDNAHVRIEMAQSDQMEDSRNAKLSRFCMNRQPVLKVASLLAPLLLAVFAAAAAVAAGAAAWWFLLRQSAFFAGEAQLGLRIGYFALIALLAGLSLWIGSAKARRAAALFQSDLGQFDDFDQYAGTALPGNHFWQWNWQNSSFTFAADWLHAFGFSDQADLAEYIRSRVRLPAVLYEQRPLAFWEQLLHPEDAAQAQQDLQIFMQAAPSGAVYRSQFRICDRNGRFRPVLAEGRAVVGPNGQVIGLATAYHDNSDSWSLQELLVQEKSFSDGLINSADLFVLLLDTKGCVLRFNPFAERITGYEEKDLLGKSWIDSLFRESEKADMRRLFERVKSGQYVRQKQANILHRNGREIELIWHYHPLTNLEGRVFKLAVIGMDISDRRALEKQLFELAFTDQLTGLANQTRLEQHLQAMIRKRSSREESLTVVYFDLDHFKHVNDALGYPAGDALLQWIADQLRQIVREPDVAARIGEDEFILLLSSYRTERSVSALIRQIQQMVHQPWQMDNHSFEMTISTGVSFYPQHGNDFKTLLQHASIALFEAKDRGRNQICFYDHQMHLRNLKYIDMVNQIHQAIKLRQFVLHYQLQYDLRSGQPRGVEALIRWHHPEQGLVPPMRFIPIAEAAGCINEITTWALEEACRQKQIWNQQGVAIGKVAVNLSSCCFRMQDLTAIITRVLAESEISGSEIELEITESALMDNIDQTLEKIRSLQDLGISFVLDDFGTGYSSLTYLHQLPVKVIKIDRCFVQTMLENPTDAMIIRAIIDLAHDLDLQVVAEGIESAKQMEMLTRYRCDYGQGFLFHYPQVAEQIILHELGHPKIIAAQVASPIHP
jgi:diguanylate cyclase (GGDEF)-like protein/PAS domain S-box-containing protein